LKNRFQKPKKEGELGNLVSISLKPNSTLYDIVPIIDKVQKRSATNELCAADIVKTIEYLEYYKGSAEKVYVECIGGYSFRGYKFRSHCTILTLTDTGGIVARKEAPETFTGRGDRFKVHLIARNQNPLSLLRFIRAYFIEYSENHIIIGIPGNKPRF
jgi:hypothetical protein